MSLLDKGRETITVYQDETWTDSDGNVMIRSSATGTVTRATLQVAAQSGTSARRAEQANEGFETEEMYRLRLPRSFPYKLGSAARIEWNGETFGVFGESRVYNGSPRTAHVEYMIIRS